MNAIELAYRRYSRKRFPLPTEAEVRALEQRIHGKFPPDYRRFLLEYNGGYFTEPEIKTDVEGCPEDLLTYMHGLHASHEEAELGDGVDLFDDNDPLLIIPIGSTPMGHLIILDTAPGEGNGDIYFKEAYGDFYHIAEGIEEFFSLLKEYPPPP